MPDPGRSLARRGVVALLGAAAGALMGFALHAIFPVRSPFVFAGIGALATALVALWWQARAARDPRRALTRAGWPALCAIAVVAVLRPFEERPPAWHIVGSAEEGQPIRGHYLSEWDAAYHRVTDFHATSDPDSRATPFRHRAEADVRSLTAIGPARLEFHATQPKPAIIDPGTGERRPGVDGVTGIVQARTGGEWTILGRLELDPTSSSWTHLDVVIPRGSERLALAWSPRANMSSDFLYAAFEAPRTASLLGLPRILLVRAGEFLLLTLAAAVAGALLRVVIGLLSRASQVPDASVSPRSRGPSRVQWILLAVVVLVPLAVAIPVAPWLEAATTPLILDWAAPDGSTVEVSFGEGPDDHVPGVRLDAKTFRAELPPRPAYKLSLSLSADAAVQAATLGDVVLVDSRDATAAIRMPAKAFEMRLADEATSRAESPGSRRTARLVLHGDVGVGRMSFAEKVGAVWIVGSALLALVFLAFRLMARRATTRDHIPAPAPGPVLPLAISALAVAALTTVWMLSAPLMVTEDTYNYLQKGEAIARTATFQTGMQGGEITRSPGYPAFIAVVLKLCGQSYTALAIAQGLFYSFALFFVASSLRRSVSTWWLVLGILAAGPLLPYLHFSRTMISESVFVSLSLIALGCFFFARRASPPNDLAWLLGFGVATAAALYTRLIGIALMASAAVVWLSGAVALASLERTLRSRVWSIVRSTIPWVLVGIIVLGSIAAWSYRNKRKENYFGFAAMVSLSNLQGELQAGMLDPRVLIPDRMYERLVRERARDSWWTVWHIYGGMFEKARAEGAHDRVIKRVEEIYEDLYRASNAQLPYAARLVKYLRSAWWNLGFGVDYTAGTKQAPLWYWQLDASLESVRPKQQAMDAMSGIPMSVAGAPLVSRIGDFFRWQANVYPTIHRVLCIAGLAAFFIALASRRPGLAAPFAFVAANWALLSYLRQHEVRYMMILDVFLIFQIVIVLGTPHTRSADGTALDRRL